MLAVGGNVIFALARFLADEGKMTSERPWRPGDECDHTNRPGPATAVFTRPPGRRAPRAPSRALRAAAAPAPAEPLPALGYGRCMVGRRADCVLCVRCAGRLAAAGTPIPETDCGDLHCSRCRQLLRAVKRRVEPGAGVGLFA